MTPRRKPPGGRTHHPLEPLPPLGPAGAPSPTRRIGTERGASPTLQRRLALAGIEPTSDAARNSRRGSTRSHTGSSFQADVRVSMSAIATLGLGFVQEHEPKFRRVPKKEGGSEWVPLPGGAPCDFSGWLNVVRDGSSYVLDRDGLPFPVVFDVKVLGAQRATYEHEPDRRHQVMSLRTAERNGAHAFLLVYVPRIEAAALIGARYFEALIMGRGVPIFDTLVTAIAQDAHGPPMPLGAGRPDLLRPGSVLEARPVMGATAHPVKLLVPAIPYRPPIGWNVAPALEYLRPREPGA
jgi:hypothetical protein